MWTIALKGQPPTVHSSSITVSDIYCNIATITWTTGNGDSRVVFLREGSAVDTFPTDNQSYNANPEFGVGTKLKGSYTVFSGSGKSVSVTGLKKGTTYHIAVFEFNNNSGNYEYLTDNGYAKDDFTTESITANFTINDNYQCLDGNFYSFTNTSSNTIGVGLSAMKYVWDYDDNTTKGTSVNETHSYAIGGIFGVKLTASTVGCETDTVLEDTVVVPFIVDFALDTSVMNNDSIQCFGKNKFSILNLSYAPPQPIYGDIDGIRNYWSYTTSGKGGKGTLYDYDFGTQETGEIRVKLVVGRRINKKEEYCLDSIEKVYVIRPPVIDSTNVFVSDSILCLSDNKFTFSHSGNNIVDTKWYFGDGDSSSSNPATHSYTASGVYEITCQVVDDNGCTALVTDTVVIVETPNNYFTGLNSKYCQGDPIVDLRPNLPGGVFVGNNVSAPDSTFDPKEVGSYSIEYIYQVGSCKDTFRVNTEVLPKPFFSIGKDTMICANTTINLRVDSSGLNYNWDDGTTTQTRTINGPGTYWVKGDNGNCSYFDTIKVIGVTLPYLELGNDTSICGGEELNFDIKSDAGTIIWSDGSSEGFSRTLTESGFYKATIIHPCGTISDSIKVDILPTACDIFIPNAISPNRDFLNEQFYPLGLFKFVSMQIWDEYGQNLFESYTEGVGWDGKVNGVVCQPGTYYYMIRYQLPENGSYVNKMAKGPLFLIW